MSNNGKLIRVVDNGYFNTKVYSNEGEKIFRSKVQETDNLISKMNTHIVELDEKIYEVGEGAEVINIDLDKTKSNIYKILTLTALGLTTKYDKMEFNIVANYPLNLYTKENKQEFEEFLKTSDYKSFILNNETKKIKINQCLVFPQTLPVIYENSVENSIVGILDIGGLTSQGLITNKGSMITSSKFSKNLGMLVLYEKIKKELNYKFNIDIQDYEIESIVKNGLYTNIEKSKEIISDVCREHVKEIVKLMQLFGWNLGNIELLITGGGGKFLFEYLKNEIPNIKLSKDPILDNLKGLWQVSQVIFNGR